MGLPQVSEEVADEVTTALSTFVSTAPQLGCVSCCDLDGMHGGSTDGTNAGDYACSSIGDFQRKTSLELQKERDGLFKYRSVASGVADLRGLQIGSNHTNNQASPTGSHSIHKPFVRVVGFETGQLPSSINSVENVIAYGHSSSAPDKSIFVSDSNGQQLRKRLLSPSYKTFTTQFHGDSLDISHSDIEIDSLVLCSKDSILLPQDHKKANTRSANEAPFWPSSKLSCSQNSFNSLACVLFTDGPVLDNKVPSSRCHKLTTWDVYSNKERTMVRPFSGEVATTPEKVHLTPLSLSPLGPRWSERMKIAGVQRDITKDIESDFSVLKARGGPGAGSRTELMFSSDDSAFRTLDAFDEASVLHYKVDPFNARKNFFVGRYCSPESAPTHYCINHVSSSSMLPVRRSLVGSFEESLLSGRFSSGKVGQSFDGFLAVLNVTCGSFSPPSQKLPFSVTSVDADSSLLYYASIDLAGSLSSSKSRGPKLSRSLSSNDSHAAKTRLRIPMKGRIQLVLSNPEMTPLHTFFCNYDLTDMPAGTKQTFMRQKITLASCSSFVNPAKEGNKDHDKKIGSKTVPKSNGTDYRECYGFCDIDNPQHCDLANKSEYISEISPVSSTSPGCDELPNGMDCMNSSDATELKNNDYNKIENYNTCKHNTCPLAIRETNNYSSKVNDNVASAGALRYALHLRFLCPPARKSSKSMQRCKSDPFSVPLRNDMDPAGERRFYLYNDLRVVFPQRHSDADEGKLQVEHHSPANPKYFGMSN